jgi:hypothetical protein
VHCQATLRCGDAILLLYALATYTFSLGRCTSGEMTC